MSTSPLTLLEAVNIVLKNDGESPVASLEEGGFGEAALAEATIHEVSRSVQTGGWGFNTDYAREFTPNVSNEIVLPAATLSITPAYTSGYRNLIERGRKLYDLDENTFTFTAKVYLDVVECLEWDDLTAAARHYIAIRAARLYQSRGTGSTAQDNFAADDEARALITLKQADGRMKRRGVFRQAAGLRAIQRRPL